MGGGYSLRGAVERNRLGWAAHSVWDRQGEEIMEANIPGAVTVFLCVSVGMFIFMSFYTCIYLSLNLPHFQG